MSKPKVMLTVDVEALPMRAESDHVNTLIYGRKDGKEYGIGKMMDIADKHNIKMTFFVDFAECELYGDDILEVGRYILSRGHDMQVHCHYDLLAPKVGKTAFVNVRDDYYSWCKNDDISKLIVDYLTDKYIECTGKMPLAFRGGEYRFGVAMLKALKEKGYAADLSYNSIRPEILPENKQFEYENGLLEFPVGILHDKKPLNFNHAYVIPKTKDDFVNTVKKYKVLFDNYFDYYGEESIASMVMHSWSFMHNKKITNKTEYFDTPNDLMVEFFDYFIDKMKEHVEFISVTEAINSTDKEMLKKVDFNTVFTRSNSDYIERLINICDLIHDKISDRNLVIWGKNVVEGYAFRNVNYYNEFKISYYISQDADKNSVWRGKPVYKFDDVNLSPEKDFVFVLANPQHTDIRDTLINLGFKEFEDWVDVQKDIVSSDMVKPSYTCTICDGHNFEAFNSDKLRRCSECGSVERTRTIPKLFSEDVNINFSSAKILHISPSIPERKLFRKYNANVTTIDIRPECRTNIVADICNMPEVESESYDVVFANCVLNHVYDDKMALSEIKRVLCSGGMALLWVLDSGTLRSYINEDPTAWYGKENYEKYKIGTFRHYGEVDFTELLRKYFSDVRCFEKYDEVTDTSCKWYRCIK